MKQHVGGDFENIILQNDIGDIEWTTTSPGLMLGTLQGAFPDGLTTIQLTNGNPRWDAYVNSPDEVGIDTYDGTWAGVNGALIGTLEITVYNQYKNYDI